MSNNVFEEMPQPAKSASPGGPAIDKVRKANQNRRWREKHKWAHASERIIRRDVEVDRVTSSL